MSALVSNERRWEGSLKASLWANIWESKVNSVNNKKHFGPVPLYLSPIYLTGLMLWGK